MRHFALLSTSLCAGLISIAPAHGLDVKVYGQVNKALVGFDDGVASDVAVVDNDHSSTRMGVKGEQKLDNGMTASVLMEMEMQSNPSNLMVQNSTAGQSSTPLSGSNAGTGNTPTLEERHAAVGLSGAWGGLWLGKTGTASDGVFTKDKAGVADIMTSDVFRIGGGLNFRTTAGAMSGATLANMTYSGATDRTNLLRYDTPKLNGFSGKLSVAQGGDMDVSAQYENKLGDLDVAAAASMKWNNDNSSTATNTIDTRTSLALSAKHSSGFAGTLAYAADGLGNETATAQDPEQWYAKVSYAWDAYQVAVDYGMAEHFGTGVTLDESELTTYGVGAQYTMGHGVSVAGMYRNFDAERSGASLQDIEMFVANVKVKF